MKKFLIVVLVVVLVLALMAGCRSAREKAAEEMAEQMLEEMFEGMADEDGNDVDIDFDEDGDAGSFTISDGDQEMVFEGDESGMAWPGDKLPGHVPEIKGVKIVATQFFDPVMTVVFEGCDESKAAAYIAAMEANGWEIVAEMDMEGMQQIQAQNGDDEWLQFTWTEEDGQGSVVYSTP